MLLEINIIKSKKINIITFKNQVYIKFYNIIVEINLKPKIRNIIKKFIIINRAITILSRNQISILLYYILLLDNRYFLFKFITLAISFFIYFVDNFFHSVIIRNNFN